MLETVDLAMFGTLVVTGPTPDHINVLIPDTVSPTMDGESLVDLQHVVGLATILSSSLPPADLVLLLCDDSVVSTLGLGQRAYWDEVNPILQKWQSVNDARCPVHTGEYVPPHSVVPHRLSVFLEVLGTHLSHVVCTRTEWEGPSREDT